MLADAGSEARFVLFGRFFIEGGQHVRRRRRVHLRAMRFGGQVGFSVDLSTGFIAALTRPHDLMQGFGLAIWQPGGMREGVYLL